MQPAGGRAAFNCTGALLRYLEKNAALPPAIPAAGRRAGSGLLAQQKQSGRIGSTARQNRVAAGPGGQRPVRCYDKITRHPPANLHTGRVFAQFAAARVGPLPQCTAGHAAAIW